MKELAGTGAADGNHSHAWSENDFIGPGSQCGLAKSGGNWRKNWGWQELCVTQGCPALGTLS